MLIRRLIRRSLGTPIDVDGHQMFLDPGDMLGLSSGEVWEPLEVGAMKSLLRPGDNAIDLGAHIGYFSLLMARIVGSEGRVWSFEPDRSNYRILKANIELNRYRNIVAENAAVGSSSGILSLFRSATNSGDHRVVPAEEERERVRVRSVSLDDYYKDGPSIAFMKMDVQGVEPEVIRGATRFLSDNPKLIFLSEFWPFGLRNVVPSAKVYFEQLVSMGFVIFDLDEDQGRIVPADPARVMGMEKRLPHVERDYTTLLCVPPAEVDRVSGALGI